MKYLALQPKSTSELLKQNSNLIKKDYSNPITVAHLYCKTWWSTVGKWQHNNAEHVKCLFAHACGKVPI